MTSARPRSLTSTRKRRCDSARRCGRRTSRRESACSTSGRSGEASEPALELELVYTGLDLSEANVRKAAELGLDVRMADASAPLPVDDDQYDCVMCLELLEHLPAAVGLLGEIRRVLKRDGRVVLSVPNPYSWVEIYRRAVQSSRPRGPPQRLHDAGYGESPGARGFAA